MSVLNRPTLDEVIMVYCCYLDAVTDFDLAISPPRKCGLAIWRLQFFTARPHCSLERFCPSVRPSFRYVLVFCTIEGTIVRFSASGRTVILVSGEVKFIRIFAGNHP